MIHRFIRFIAILFSISVFFTSCGLGPYMFLFGEDDVDERYNGFRKIEASLPSVPDSGKYSVVVVSDVHFGASDVHNRDKAAFYKEMEKLFKKDSEDDKPRFIISLGDSVNGGYHSEYKEYISYFDSIKQLAKDCGVVSAPEDFNVYTVVGNHDLYNKGYSEWKETVYPNSSSYCFTIKGNAATDGFSYYFLDSANGSLGTDQLKDFEALVKADKSPKIINTHYAFYAGNTQIFLLTDTIERNHLLSLFEKNKVRLLLGGHDHAPASHSFGKFKQVLVSALFKNRGYTILTVDENTGTVTAKHAEF